MESALYDAEDGFYARGARLGARGAFTTAPIASPFLARALAADLRGRLAAHRTAGAVHARRDGPGRRLPGGGPGGGAGRPAARPRAVRALGGDAGPGAGPCSRQRVWSSSRSWPASRRDRRQRGARRLPGPSPALARRAARRTSAPTGASCWSPGPPAGGSAMPCSRRRAPRAGAEYDVSPAQAELQRSPRPRARARRADRARLRRGGRAAATSAPCRGCAPTSAAWPAAIRWRPRARRTSRSTSTSARVRAPARREGLRTTLDSRSRSGCSRTAPPRRSRRCRATMPSGCGSRRSAIREGSGAAFRVLVQERE